MGTGPPREVLLNERRRVAQIGRLVVVGVIAAVAIGAVVAYLPRDTSEVIPSVTLLLIVLATSLAGGAAAGIIAAALATVGMEWAFIPIRESFEPKTTTDLIATALFAFATVIVVLAVRQLDTANRRVTREKLTLDILDDLTSALGTTLDPTVAIRRATQVIVPTLADSCSIDLLDGDGLRRVAFADASPSTIRLAAALERQAPSAEGHPSVRAVTTGNVFLQRRVKDTHLRAMVVDDAHLQLLRKLRPASMLAVPLVYRGQTVGALMLAHGKRSHRRFSLDDVPLVQEIAARLARAVRNAQVFETDRRAVEVLQRTLLPEELPRVDGVRLSRLYRPAAAEVGGDWYAIVPLPPGRVGLAVGDVAGHGVESATVMANLRFALKAVAFDGAKPGEVLARLNQMMHHYENDTFVTACYGVLDLEAMLWQQALAGHMPPVLAHDGSARLLDSTPGPPLGVASDPGYADETYDVEPGSRLLLYSDGLVERRGESLSVGMERLRVIAAHGTADLETLAEHLADPSAEDDVVVLSAVITRR